MDEHDIVVELADLPRPDAGAPCPMVLADEGRIWLLYYGAISHPTFDGTNPQSVSPNRTKGPVVVVRAHSFAHCFCAISNETLPAHPLYEKGLGSYGCYQVKGSSWIRAIDRMEQAIFPCAHGVTRPYRHVIVTFHDSLFEMVIDRYEIETTHGRLADVYRSVSAEVTLRA